MKDSEDENHMFPFDLVYTIKSTIEGHFEHLKLTAVMSWFKINEWNTRLETEPPYFTCGCDWKQVFLWWRYMPMWSTVCSQMVWKPVNELVS